MRFSFMVLSVVIIFTFFSPSSTQATDCPVETEKAYKAPKETSVYYVTSACTKRAFDKSNVFFTYFDSWNDVLQVETKVLSSIPNDQLGFMPWGPKYDPKYGALVKTVNDPKVYFLLGNEKRWVDSEESFLYLGYKWNWIEDVDSRLLDKYTPGKEITYLPDVSTMIQFFVFHPNYTLIKRNDDPKVYRLEPHPLDPKRTVARHIANEEVFSSLNYRMDRIIEVPNTKKNGTKVLFSDNFVRDFSEENVVDSLATALLGDPILSGKDVFTINVDEELLKIKKSSVSKNNYLHSEPLYGLSFEYPKKWHVEHVPSFLSLMGYYQLGILPEGVSPPETADQTVDMVVVSMYPGELIKDQVSRGSNIFDTESLSDDMTVSELAVQYGAMIGYKADDIKSEYHPVLGETLRINGKGVGKNEDLLFAKNGKNLYVVSVTYTSETEAEYKEVYSKIIDSIKYISLQ